MALDPNDPALYVHDNDQVNVEEVYQNVMDNQNFNNLYIRNGYKREDYEFFKRT